MALTQQLMMVLAVFALLGGLLWLMRRRGGFAFSPRRTGARQVEVLERVPLTPQHSLHLVRVAGKVVLIGTAPHACTLLDHSASEAFSPRDLLRTAQ